MSLSIHSLETNVVTLGGDPWTEWVPLHGEEPSMMTLHHARKWAEGQTRDFGGRSLSGDELAAVVLARTFPDAR
jgi:hypothetical protein